MVAVRETQAYRQDARTQGKTLTPKEREDLLKPYLPTPPRSSSPAKARGRRPVRSFLRSQLHLLLHTLIHAIFSLYVRLRQTHHAIFNKVLAILYYHHRTPELIKKDVGGLSRLPEHLSVILELNDAGQGGAGLEILMDEVAEIAAWSACVGIPMLSIYEKTGMRFVMCHIF